MAKMTRYKVLRRIGCDPVTAGLLAFTNYVMGVPAGIVGTMLCVIEFDPNEEVED